jgi:hypothetical protein
MPRWSSAGRVTCASAASTVFGSTQAFLVAVGLAALTRLGVAATTSALTVLGVVLPVLAVAVSLCWARGRGCDESEVEAFELCVLLSQASMATVSLWPCHRRARPPAPRILPPRMEAWPDDFSCPISLEVMTDPVILPLATSSSAAVSSTGSTGAPHLPHHQPPAAAVPAAHPQPCAPPPCRAATPMGGGGSREAKEMGSPSSVLALLRLAKSGAAGWREVLESDNTGGAPTAMMDARVCEGIMHEWW